MRFCWSTLAVKNMDESIKFYKEIVGLELVKRYQSGKDTEIAFLNDAETKIELICNKDKKEINIGQDILWGFYVDSVEKQMALVKEKGVEITSGPFQPNPFTKFFFITDPNGMKIQFVENMS